MAIYHYTATELKPVSETKFGAEGILERQDLQRLLKAQIDVIDERLMVIAEEFGDWVDSSRRIDLLCLDTDANLVVVELKRTEDGGHMELQALRYAAMVSAMTFEQLVDTHARYKSPGESDTDGAKAAILAFLGWSSVDENHFAQDTRIVLAAADFGKELTTAVMWLIDRGIDIRCVRLKPYRMADGTILLDVQQLIPLPEAADFQTQIGVKKQAERQSRSAGDQLRLQFWERLLQVAKAKTSLHAGRNPNTGGVIRGSIGRAGFALNYVVNGGSCRVELWISMEAHRSKAAFAALAADRERIDADFEGHLDWQELSESNACRICLSLDGGYNSPPSDWSRIAEELSDAMVRLDRAMRTRVANLKF